MRRFSLFLALCLCLSIPVFSEQSAPIYRYGTSKTQVALSFDDGPHASYTAEILDILAEENVKSTFFVIGQNAEAHPELLQRMHSEGHEIGNHTYSHVFLREVSLAVACKEITRTSELVEQLTGQRPTLFRPPGGSYNDRKIQTITDMGYTCVLWSKDTRDWARPSVQSIVHAALCDLQGGDIILFHDFNGASSPTPEALRLVISGIRSRGFSIVPVGELLGA